MTALPRNQYSTTFSLDGIASPASPHRGRHTPVTFKPVPLKAFTVVVSIVPADQLRHHSAAPPITNHLACALDGVAGAVGVGGPPSMASSVPVGSVPSTPGFMMNASFGPASSSFALTKSFGDVFSMRKAAPGNAAMASSVRSTGSFGSAQGLGASSSAAAAAAAAVRGLADPSVGETPVQSSLDSYRVHLLLPPEYQKHAANTAAAAHASQRQCSLNSTELETLSAATSSLEALRTAKRRQAAQVNEYWLRFQQLVRFVLSVAPRFEPPPTPPGFAFPVDLGLSFVQNSSIFSAAEAAQLGRSGVGTGGIGGGGSGSSSPARQVTVFADGSFSSPLAASKATAEDPLVRGEEREARRAYIEAYLNAALQCDQVNCLKELQSFVGYDAYVKNELAHFRVMSRTSSSSSFLGSPAAAMANNTSQHRFGASRMEFPNKGPLGSSSQSTSSRSQCTVSTTSSPSHRTGSATGTTTSAMQDVAAMNTAKVTRLTAPATVTTNHNNNSDNNAGSRAASSHPSEMSPPLAGSAFSASPPTLARSQPPGVSPSFTSAEGSQRSSSTVAAPLAGSVGPTAGSVVEVIDFASAKTAPEVRASTEAASSAGPSVVFDGDAQQSFLAKTVGGGITVMEPELLSSITSSRPDRTTSRFLYDSAAATAAAADSTSTLFGKPLALSQFSSGSHHPLGSSVLPRSGRGLSASESLLLGAVEVDGRRSSGSGRRGEEGDVASSLPSSHSAGSSFGSSVSHPGSTRRRSHRGHHHHHHRGGDRESLHTRSDALLSSSSVPTQSGAHDHSYRRRHHSRDSNDADMGCSAQVGEREDWVGAGAREAAAAAAPPLSSSNLAAPSQTTVSRAALKSLVSIAPETERMLKECFRMMDSVGCGYVSAGDCALFYLCATPDTFAEALYLYTTTSSNEKEKEEAASSPSAAAAAAGGAPPVAQLEALLPGWMRDCESVVLGNPHYLMSSTRFVDAVREILAASAFAATGLAAAATTTGGGEERDLASSTPVEGKAQTSAGGEGTSRNNTPASSLPSPGGVPAVLGGSLFSRDGRRREDGTPLQLPVDVAGGAGLRTYAQSFSTTGSTRADNSDGASSPVAEAAPIASLEAWIDNYWLLLYSHLFTAVAALVVGPEAAALRAALLDIRERAYLEMTAQVATAAAAAAEARQIEQQQQSSSMEHVDAAEATSAQTNSPDRLLAAPSLIELTSPPWLLREVAHALAAQPPLLGCFDALELLSLVYVISESGIAVVGQEEVLQWLGTRSSLPNTRFSLDEFASLLDVLSCSLPFADVLHCMRRQHQTQHGNTSAVEGGEADRVGSLGRPESGQDKTEGEASAGLAHPAHLLRLVSRCATADPAGGREFNELVQEQRWRRGGGDGLPGGGRSSAGGGARTCELCLLARGVLEQQAVLLASLSDENAALQLRVAELEAAAAAATAITQASATDRPSTTTAATSAAAEQAGGPTAAVPASTSPLLTVVTAETHDGGTAPHDLPVTESAAPTADASSTIRSGEAPPHASASSTRTLSLPSTSCNAQAGATAQLPPPSAAHRATLELVPVYTAEIGEAGHVDPHSQRRSSRQARAAATQVARAGPLLYTVPPKYERRQPSELEFGFYLCRVAPRREEKSEAAALALGSAVGAQAATAPVERLTVRDAAGHRVVAFKVSSNVLHILGRDPAPSRGARLLVGPAQRVASKDHPHRTLHGTSPPPPLPPSPKRGGERRRSHGVVSRAQNILYPSYDDKDGEGSSENPYVFLQQGDRPIGLPSPRRSQNDLDVSSVGGRSGGPQLMGASSTPASIVDAPPQRLVARVELSAHVWYTMRLRMDWTQHVVEVAVTCMATTTTAVTGNVGPAPLTRSGDAPPSPPTVHSVYEGTFRMLDTAEASGLTSIEISPRREMLVAYCNMLIRYEAEDD